MNYPVWELNVAGGGFLMVVIAVVHVYVAHFAVGGGLFLVLTEMKAYRENDADILAYVKAHTRFFLLLTMVFGGITGVGIWFTISLLSPAATSTLVHTFVFGWATEWVCFLCEIVALFLYYYRFDKIDRSSHLTLGWLYFIFAWLSLFFINGIIDFMLTPGDWLETKSFWDGFFNPSMLPALVFRTALCLFLAGIFGFVTAVFFAGPRLKSRMLGYCSQWLVFPLPVMALSAVWYLSVLPDAVKTMILDHSPEMPPVVTLFGGLLPVFLILALVMRLNISARVHIVTAFVCLLTGLVYMGAFEWIREAGRRPYLIYGHTYSTAVRVGEEAALYRDGVLKTARWVRHRTLTPQNELKAGREIFRITCMGCHSVGGPINDILPLTADFSMMGMQAQLNGQGKLLTYMPPFMGTGDERRALARYIVSGLHNRKEPARETGELHKKPVTPPPFDQATAKYVLLAWPERGIHHMTDSDRYWSFQPPDSTIYAQLILRGSTPEIVTDGVSVAYAVEKAHSDPAGQVEFWTYAASLTGRAIPVGTGLTGATLAGRMPYNDELMAFRAEHLPLAPYRKDGSFNPYPRFILEARDAETGELLAQTALVAPVSTEMGCKNCHGNAWDGQDRVGIDGPTAQSILAVHDRISKTDLLSEARKGKPRLCQTCHPGNLPGVEAEPGHLGLSSAMHGFHANYLGDLGDDACSACHPSAPQGATHGFRGIHREIELTCTNCHLSLQDHALSLLAAEKQAGMPRAEVLMRHLSSSSVDTHDAIAPRMAWTGQPDCLNCHVDFQPPETDQVEYSTWTRTADQLYSRRTDDVGLMCMACHGATHAIYPARNPYGEDLDNLQPLQYQKTPYPIGSDGACRVCHTMDMEDEIHHPNMLGGFRNTR